MRIPGTNPRFFVVPALIAAVCLFASCAAGPDPETHMTEGRTAYVLRDFKAAEEYFTAVLEAEPENVEAWYYRGLARHMQDDGDGALADFDRCIELAPDLAKAWSMRGGVQLARFNFEAAVRDLDKAIALDPDFPYSYVNRATAFVMLGFLKEGLADCDRTLALSPHNRLAWHTKAIARYLEGRIPQAIESAEKALTLGPEWAATHFILGGFYDRIRQKEKAAAHFKRAVELDPGVLIQMAAILEEPVHPDVKTFHRDLLNAARRYLAAMPGKSAAGPDTKTE